MANFLGLGNRKSMDLTEREEYIFKIVDGMLKIESTVIRVNPENMDYFINNEEHHLDIIIGSSYIAITNTTTYVKEDFRDDFINHCKTSAKIRAAKDRENLKQNIMHREINMFDKIIRILDAAEQKKLVLDDKFKEN
jgi:hypothetical protein